MLKNVPDLSQVPLHQFLPRRHTSHQSYLNNNKKKTGKAKKKKKKSKGKKTNLGPKAKSASPGTILPQIKGAAARTRSFDASEGGSIISGGSRRSSVPLIPFYKRSETDRRLCLLGRTRNHHRVGLWDHHHEDQKKLRELAQRQRALAHHITEEEREQLYARERLMKSSDDDFSQLSKPKPRPWMTSAYCEDAYYDMKNHLTHGNEGDELHKVKFATPDSEVLAAYAFVMKSFEHTRKKKENAKTSLESLQKELGLYKNLKPPSITAPKSRTPKASKAFLHSPKTMAAARASAERRQQMLLASVKESMNESRDNDDFDDGFGDSNGGDGPEVSASVEQTESKDTLEESGNNDDDDGDDDFDDGDDDFEDDDDVVDDGDADNGNNDGGSDGDDNGGAGNGGDEIKDDVDDGDDPSDGGSGNANSSGEDGGGQRFDGEKDGDGGGDDEDEDFEDDDFEDDDFDDDDFEDD